MIAYSQALGLNFNHSFLDSFAYLLYPCLYSVPVLYIGPRAILKSSGQEFLYVSL